MSTPLKELQTLLAASRALACAEELDAARLQQWSAEREMIFARLQGHDLTSAVADSTALAALIHELLALDGEIRARVIEYQARIGEQIAASQRVRRVLPLSGANSVALLRRSA